jgi:hypothetical protein
MRQSQYAIKKHDKVVVRHKNLLTNHLMCNPRADFWYVCRIEINMNMSRNSAIAKAVIKRYLSPNNSTTFLIIWRQRTALELLFAHDPTFCKLSFAPSFERQNTNIRQNIICKSNHVRRAVDVWPTLQLGWPRQSMSCQSMNWSDGEKVFAFLVDDIRVQSDRSTHSLPSMPDLYPPAYFFRWQ